MTNASTLEQTPIPAGFSDYFYSQTMVDTFMRATHDPKSMTTLMRVYAGWDKDEKPIFNLKGYTGYTTAIDLPRARIIKFTPLTFRGCYPDVAFVGRHETHRIVVVELPTGMSPKNLTLSPGDAAVVRMVCENYDLRTPVMIERPYPSTRPTWEHAPG